MKNSFLKLMLIFSFVLTGLNTIKAQVIEMVSYTPARAQIDYDSNYIYRYDNIIVRDLSEQSKFDSLTSPNVIAFGLFGITLMGNDDTLTGPQTKTAIDLYTDLGNAKITEVSVGKNGGFYTGEKDVEIDDIATSSINANDVTGFQKLTLPATGQLVIDSVVMNNPGCTLTWVDLPATANSEDTASPQFNTYYFAYCASSDATYYPWKGSITEIPAIARCTAGWTNNDISDQPNSPGKCYVGDYTNNVITESSFYCDSVAISPCPSGIKYTNRFNYYVTSAARANPNKIYVESNTSVPAVCNNQARTNVAEPLYTTDAISNAKYLPYPAYFVYDQDNCPSSSMKLKNDTRSMYCGFSSEEDMDSEIDYAKNIIYALKNEPSCSVATPGTTDECQSYLSAGISLDNFRHLPPEALCDAIYRNRGTSALSATRFTCVINPPDRTSYQAVRSITSSLTQAQKNVCVDDDMCNTNGHNYCNRTEVQTVKQLTTSDDWLNVDSQGYADYDCKEIEKMEENGNLTDKKLLALSDSTYFPSQEFTAKILSCESLL
jgi:hypothetical protein